MAYILDKFEQFYTKRARFKIAYGGRGGGKSHCIAQMLLIIGAERKEKIFCLREYQKNLDDSVYELMVNKIMEAPTLRNVYRIFSDRIVCTNGTTINFSGIKNAANIKSFEGITIAWLEEAQAISAESLRILVPTIRKDKSELWFSYNPLSEDDPVHKRMLKPMMMTPAELKETGYDEAQINVFINYTDNPLVSNILKREAETLRENDYDSYRHVYLGETRDVSDALIFKDKFTVQDFTLENYYGFPRFQGDNVEIFYGLDFGWMHPTAMVETFIHNGNIYISSEIVGKEMDLDTIATRFCKEFQFVAGRRVYADSARPDNIADLSYPRYTPEGEQIPALDIHPANKGAGSVESGIAWLKNHKKIIIHPSCVETIKNFKNYAYKKNNRDIITTVIAKIHDDCIDALRYAYSPLIGTSTVKIDWSDPELLREASEDHSINYFL